MNGRYVDSINVYFLIIYGNNYFLVLNMLITNIFDYKIPIDTFQIHILIFIIIVTHPVRLSEFTPKYQYQYVYLLAVVL